LVWISVLVSVPHNFSVLVSMPHNLKVFVYMPHRLSVLVPMPHRRSVLVPMLHDHSVFVSMPRNLRVLMSMIPTWIAMPSRLSNQLDQNPSRPPNPLLPDENPPGLSSGSCLTRSRLQRLLLLSGNEYYNTIGSYM